MARTCPPAPERLAVRAVVYSRVSTAGQADGFSLQSQAAAGIARAKELGATSILELEDTFTGMDLNRPALERLRTAVRDGRVDLVVVYDPDRFSRNLNDLLLITTEMDRYKTRLEFVNFTWEHTPQGLLFLQLRGAIAQFEHAQIRERTLRGRRAKAKSGGLGAFVQPYGYRFVSSEDRLQVDAQQASWLLQMFQWRLDGLGPTAIARRLETLGVPGPQGGLWHPQTVARILHNPVYVGRLRRRHAEDDWLPVPVPALVPEHLYTAVQNQPRSRRRCQSSAPGLLSGLLRCGHCQRAITVRGQSRHGARRYAYYQCAGRYSAGCRQPALPRAALDRAAWLALTQAIAAAWPLAPAQNTDAAATKGALKGQFRGLERAAERARQAYIKGLWSLEQYSQHICEQTQLRAELERQLASADHRAATRLDVETMRRALSLAERQAIVADLVLEARLTDETLVLKMVVPSQPS